MSKFKIGDKVREISTGDEGAIEDYGASSNHWWIKWSTGEYNGYTLGLYQDDFILIENFTNEITFQQAVDALLQLGYKVQLEKI